MKLLRHWLFLSLLASSAPLQAVVIVVHGSFAHKNTWWQPGGQFHDMLAVQALAKGHTVLPFRWKSGWHGGWMGQSIKKAGKQLAKVMKPYLFKEQVILIGHSNGANVLLDACKRLKKAGIKQVGASYPVTRMYALAPTISKADISAIMDVVGSVVNCFSLDDEALDKLEPLGVYQRVYDGHERVYNYLVRASDNDGTIVTFKHCAMYDVRVARWLLELGPNEPHQIQSIVPAHLASVLLFATQVPVYGQLSDAELARMNKLRIMSQSTALLSKGMLVPRALHSLFKAVL